MEAERDVILIDQHKAWIEEPYALILRINGEITGVNLRRMLELMDYIGGGQGPVVIVQDLSKSGAFTAPARKGIMEDERAKRVVTVISIGASFQLRVFITMIGKAMKIVDPKVAATLFAKNDAEAWEMLAIEQERLRQKN